MSVTERCLYGGEGVFELIAGGKTEQDDGNIGSAKTE